MKSDSQKKAAPSGASLIATVHLLLRGRADSRLVVHAFSEKAKNEIRAKQQKKVKEAKPARDPQQEFLDARNIDAAGRECIPLMTIKKAIITAATAFDDLTKVALRQAIFLKCDADPASQLVPIETHDGQPAVGAKREDAVTIGINTRGLVYRPEYLHWQVRVTAEINTRLVSIEQFKALVDHAGWGVGICEGRPEKTSALSWGRFERVESA